MSTLNQYNNLVEELKTGIGTANVGLNIQNIFTTSGIEPVMAGFAALQGIAELVDNAQTPNSPFNTQLLGFTGNVLIGADVFTALSNLANEYYSDPQNPGLQNVSFETEVRAAIAVGNLAVLVTEIANPSLLLLPQVRTAVLVLEAASFTVEVVTDVIEFTNNLNAAANLAESLIISDLDQRVEELTNQISLAVVSEITEIYIEDSQRINENVNTITTLGLEIPVELLTAQQSIVEIRDTLFETVGEIVTDGQDAYQLVAEAQTTPAQKQEAYTNVLNALVDRFDAAKTLALTAFAATMAGVESATDTLLEGTDEIIGLNVWTNVLDGNVVIGTSVSDRIEFTGDADITFDTRAGNDFIKTIGIGNHSVDAGSGDDEVILGQGTHSVTTGAGNDEVSIAVGNGSINTGGGADVVTVGLGTYTINLGTGDDLASLNGGSYTVSIGSGYNNITAADGSTGALLLGEGDSRIITNNSNFEVLGGNGDHNLTMDGDDISIELGNGNNTIKLGLERFNYIPPGTTNAQISVGSGNNTIQLGSGNFNITSGYGTNSFQIEGTANATIVASYGSDFLSNRTGSFLTGIVNLGHGNNSINLGTGSSGDFSVITGSGTDSFVSGAGNIGRVFAALGAGNDNAQINGSVGVNLDLSGGNDSARLFGNENFIDLGTGDDTISVLGTQLIPSLNNIIDASQGHNTLLLGAGAYGTSVLFGDGNDSVSTGTASGSQDISFAANSLNLGEGNNYVFLRPNDPDFLLSLTSGSGPDEIRIDRGHLTVQSGAGEDEIRLTGSSSGLTNAGEGNDIIITSSGTHEVHGGGGDDYIKSESFGGLIVGSLEAFGGMGNDVFENLGQATFVAHGGEGDDVFLGQEASSTSMVFGDAGNDSIIGHYGTVFGGDGDDQISMGYQNYSGGPGFNGTFEVFIDGGAGDDFIETAGLDVEALGGLGNDTFKILGNNGFPTNNVHRGGPGSDHYDINGRASTKVVIDDLSSPGDINTIDIGGEGFYNQKADRLYIEGDELHIVFDAPPARPGDSPELELIIKNFNKNNVLESVSFDSIQIQNSTFTYEAFFDAHSIEFIGTEGDDTIVGSSVNDYIQSGLLGNDNLSGGDGNDVIDSGERGNNILNGGDGDDYLKSGFGDDALFGGNGNDIFYYTGGQDTIEDSSGIDELEFKFYNKEQVVILNDPENDAVVLRFYNLDRPDEITPSNQSITIALDGSGSPVVENLRFSDGTTASISTLAILGTDGDDIITGTPLDDLISGGAGNDQIQGGAGDDTYFYGFGDGQDIIADTSGTDKIQFGDSLIITSLLLEKDLNTQLATILFSSNDTASPDSPRLIIALNQDGTSSIESIEYADGSSSFIDQLPVTVIGSDADDSIQTDLGDDTINGGLGNDVVNAGAGNDTYVYNIGDGVDSISDLSGSDRISFGPDVLIENLTFSKDLLEDKLKIGFLDESKELIASDGIEIDFNGSENSPIEFLFFNTNDEVTIIEVASLRFGSNVIGTPGDDNPLQGSTGDDILQGLGGADTLIGDRGNDTYIYRLGDGHDVVYDSDGLDTIFFPEDVLPEDVKILRNVSNSFLSITFLDELGDQIDSDQIDIVFRESLPFLNIDSITDSLIEKLQFSDGTELTIDVDLGASIVGSAGNDTLRGKAADDTLIGGPGNDLLAGLEGLDTYRYSSGDGHDTITDNYADGNIIEFGAEIEIDDIDITWNLSTNFVNVNFLDNDGNQILNDQLDIEYNIEADAAASEVFQFADGNMASARTDFPLTIVGSRFNNQITGSQFSDTISGGTGNDTINGGDGNDTYIYNSGDGIDFIADTTGLDVIVFGSSINPNDVLVSARLENPEYITINFLDTGSVISGDEIRLTYDLATPQDSLSIENFRFDNGSIISFLNDIEFSGTSDDDSLSSPFESANYTWKPGLGNDLVNSSVGNDTFFYNLGDGADVIVDSGGDDKLVFGNGITAANLRVSQNTDTNQLLIEFLDTNDGLVVGDQLLLQQLTTNESPIEIVEFFDGTTVALSDFIVNVISGTNENDSITGTSGDDEIYGLDGDDSIAGGVGIDLVVGGNGNDFLKGNGQDDSLRGEAGDDILKGGNDNDFLDGGADNDLLEGGNGDDSLFGQDGADSLKGQSGNDSLYGGSGDDFLHGGSGEDVLEGGAGNDTLEGNGQKDTLKGGGGNDILNGGGGADILKGNGGRDSLFGQNGKDTLYGNGGKDLLDGGKGNDTLYGGNGNDEYIYNAGSGIDTIFDSGTNTNSDILSFGELISFENLWFTQTGDDLNIGIVNSNDKVIIEDWYSNDGNQIETIRTEFATLDHSAVDNLVTAMSSITDPTGTGGSLSQSDQTALAIVISSNWILI